MTTFIEKINEAKKFIEAKKTPKIEVGLILGSGLGELGDDVQEKIVIPYAEIPHFPQSTVQGHAGQLVIGKLGNREVMVMQGRFHYYEGYAMEQVTFPVRVMKALGIDKIIVTNAAGGVNQAFTPGNLMLIEDQINYMGNNPLIGPNHEEFGTRFPDMSNAYTHAYFEMVEQEAGKLKIDLKKGIYMGFSGPTYETPAEIRMARTMGADAVGMSTVPEVIVAAHCQMNVIGISCITNLAAGMQKSLNHHEVVETTERVKHQFKQLVFNILQQMV